MKRSLFGILLALAFVAQSIGTSPAASQTDAAASVARAVAQSSSGIRPMALPPGDTSPSRQNYLFYYIAAAAVIYLLLISPRMHRGAYASAVSATGSSPASAVQRACGSGHHATCAAGPRDASST